MIDTGPEKVAKVRPKYKVGDVVTTRFTVPVLNRGLHGRKWLFLLPGCEWRVAEVRDDSPRLPIYVLKCDRFTIERKEHRIRPLKRVKGASRG